MTSLTASPEQQQEQQEIPWAWVRAVNDILSGPPYGDPSKLPVQLNSWLFLSDQHNSLNSIDQLMGMGITHVLTTNKLSPEELGTYQEWLQKVGIVHKAVAGEDEYTYDMIGNHWEECRSFLNQVKNSPDSKVVVHCFAGMNRSGLIAAAAMMILKERPTARDEAKQIEAPEQAFLLDVVRDIKIKRGLVLTNPGFQRQLCVLAAKEGYLGEIPSGSSSEPEHQQEQQEIPWAWVRAVNDILLGPPYGDPSKLPVQLNSWLFLSDQHNSLNSIDQLMDMGITHVLTTNKLSPEELVIYEERLQKVGIVHKAVAGEDEYTYDMIGNHWEECRSFLNQVKNSPDSKVVVHCFAGMNRSGLIAAAAMMILKERPTARDEAKQIEAPEQAFLLDVVRDIKIKRGLVLTNPGFQRQLCVLAAKEGYLGEIPSGYSSEPMTNVTRLY